MKIGHVKFVRPENPILKKWIKGYYVHASDKNDFYSKVTFYQNITTTISVYKDSLTSSKGRYRKQRYKKGEGYTQLLVGLVDNYQEVEFYGPLNRIAIVFYPGGINHFLREPLSNFLKPHYSVFNAFGDSFVECLNSVYKAEVLETKQHVLDTYFRERYHAFEDREVLRAIHLLTNSEHPVKVGELSSRLGLNRRTLLRRFKKHLGYSIEEYISIVRFRKALDHFQKQQNSKNLSKIAIESHYYDQPDFNHHIKSRSDMSPKQLFEKLKIVDEVLFWKL